MRVPTITASIYSTFWTKQQKKKEQDEGKIKLPLFSGDMRKFQEIQYNLQASYKALKANFTKLTASKSI